MKSESVESLKVLSPSREKPRNSTAESTVKMPSAMADFQLRTAAFSLGQPSLDEVFFALTGGPGAPQAGEARP